ncbi:MAG: aryl-sulfate sulfotransferase [Bryobacteraceae bacterium]
MKRLNFFYAAGMLALIAAAPLSATVTIASMTPSVASPQPLGTPITWKVTATDSSSNTLTFRFSVANSSGTLLTTSDYNLGTSSAGVWTSEPFVWNTIAGEGYYIVQVIAKDFVTGESATKTASYELGSRVTGGTAVVHSSANTLVAIFSAPACTKGSTMNVAFYPTSSPTSINYTNTLSCNGSTSMNFYVAGMLPTTAYTMYSQTMTGSKTVDGTKLSFSTHALPSKVLGGYFPTFTQSIAPPAGDPNPMLLWAFTKIIVPVATDLNGNIMWYYGNGLGTLLLRPVVGASGTTMLTIQNGKSWDSSNSVQQLLEEVDLAGNLVHQTNTGIISNQLVALGATDAVPCGQIVQPAKVGDACLNDFHHDAIRLPNGYTAFMAHVEKLFPAGTQGHAGSDPVDILSEMVIVLNTNWEVTWYYDAFNELNINRTAPLGETCSAGSSDCPTDLFLSTSCNDWTHANTVDYVAASSNADYGDFLVSMRDQDQVIRVHYNNGAGSCAPTAPSCIVWTMGPPDDLPQSNFMFSNIYNDAWPWFSHQHDVTYASSGLSKTINGQTGPLLTIFDNGNTRYSVPPLGLGTACDSGPYDDCYSRGMALMVTVEPVGDCATSCTQGTVVPILSQSLGMQSTALGGAQVLSNGNYFYQSGISNVNTQAIEILPGTPPTGTQVMNVQSVDYSYRGWQMPNLYNPPTL